MMTEREDSPSVEDAKALAAAPLDTSVEVESRPTYLESSKWNDPYPDVTGVLLNDYIELYSAATGLVVTCDDSEVGDHVEPASYTLRVGRSQYIDGEEKTLETGAVIRIPPNGLVYVSVLEEINIPYYMIARMNLRVKQVYRGLLLGTGPQVDPGFSGHLNCPIHNLTDTEKILRFGENLATIDFIKTTPFGRGNIVADSELDLQREDIRGRADISMRKWKADSGRHSPLTQDRTITPMLPPGESVRSSLSDLSARLRTIEGAIGDEFVKARTDIRTETQGLIGGFRTDVQSQLRNTRLLGFGSLGGLAIAVIVLIFQLQQSVTNALVPNDPAVERLQHQLDGVSTLLAGALPTATPTKVNSTPAP